MLQVLQDELLRSLKVDYYFELLLLESHVHSIQRELEANKGRHKIRSCPLFSLHLVSVEILQSKSNG